MDKKNALIGVLFLLAALGAMFWNAQQTAERQREESQRQREAPTERVVEGDDSGEVAEEAPPLVRAPTLADAGEREESLVRTVRERLQPEGAAPEETAVLENAYFRAVFTTRGAALKNLALIARESDGDLAFPVTPDGDEPVVLHAVAKTRPLTLAQERGGRFSPLAVPFSIVEETADRVVFEAEVAEGFQLRRSFELVEGEEDTPANYTIRQEISLHNASAQPLELDRLFLNIGTAAPTNTDPYGMDLNASYLDDGDYENIKAGKFKGGWFSDPQDRIARPGTIQWGAVKNQFFASILTPELPGSEFVALPVVYPNPSNPDGESTGVTAFVRFDLPMVEAGASETLRFDYYTGPKDFTRLKQMPLEQEDVMHFGWFLGMFLGLIGFVGKMLFSLLSALHGVIGNWGFAIIFMTLIVRLLLWPLTAKAARSSKRMQELQKPMQEIKEKYKDNPQKQQQATLELFKKHKINPLSSCWPVLLQFPIFIAMFNLLRNTADLRFAEFLWITDLSMPDRSIPLGDASLPFVGNAINILPFFWLASMWFQMKMMPQPSVDNAQTKIIKYFPFIFFPATYFFSSGLVLYWTTTNCFSIFQGWMTRRSKDAEDIAIEQEIAESEKKKSVLRTEPIGAKKKKKKGGPGAR